MRRGIDEQLRALNMDAKKGEIHFFGEGEDVKLLTIGLHETY